MFMYLFIEYRTSLHATATQCSGNTMQPVTASHTIHMTERRMYFIMITTATYLWNKLRKHVLSHMHPTEHVKNTKQLLTMLLYLRTFHCIHVQGTLRLNTEILPLVKRTLVYVLE